MVALRIRKIKKKEYYYLEHTMRKKGGGFENKRIYLGNAAPDNPEGLKEKFIGDILLERFGADLKRIKAGFRKEMVSYPEVAKEKYLESFMIRFTYDSNRIEGSTLTLKETADLLQDRITPAGRPLRDVRETEAHKKAFYDMLGCRGRLDLATVLHWHKILFSESDPEIAGKIRKHHVAIARSKAELALPAELDSRLHDFFKWYDAHKDKMDPVVLAALVHLRFVTIHPFSDGNGRISRLMMNFVLRRYSYPMLNIEYGNRNAYYNALERSQTRKDDFTFAQYLVKRYIKTYSRYLQ